MKKPIEIKIIFVVTTLISSAFLYGCDRGDGGNSTGELTELEGQWYSECIKTLGTISHWEIFSFSGNRITYNNVFFQDEACKRVDLEHRFNRESTGTFSIGKELITSDGLNAKKLNLNFGGAPKKYTFRIDIQETLYFGGEYRSSSADTGLAFSYPFRKK